MPVRCLLTNQPHVCLGYSMSTISDIQTALQAVCDPELGYSVVDLGLVYDVRYDEVSQHVQIVMTLTSPTCPFSDQLTAEIKKVVQAVPHVAATQVTLTFEPRWSLARASEEVRQELALRGISATAW